MQNSNSKNNTTITVSNVSENSTIVAPRWKPADRSWNLGFIFTLLALALSDGMCR
jgi:hypothetical protein